MLYKETFVGRYMLLASQNPNPIIAYSVVKMTPSQLLLSKSIFCNPNLLTFSHFLNHESFYFIIPNYQSFNYHPQHPENVQTHPSSLVENATPL